MADRRNAHTSPIPTDGAVSPALHRSPVRFERGRPAISVVVPLHDEQENVVALAERLQSVLESCGLDYEVVLVDDGSRDATPDLLDAVYHDERAGRDRASEPEFRSPGGGVRGPRACPGPGRRRHGRRPARPARTDSRARFGSGARATTSSTPCGVGEARACSSGCLIGRSIAS